ncbi:MAG: aminopeptidase [Anaerolineales bacterium]
MTDPRIKKLAQVLVNYSTEVKEKQLVAIMGRPNATALINEVYREVLRAGAYPYVLTTGFPPYTPGLQGLDNILYSEANQDQLGQEDIFYKLVCEKFDVRILIYSEYNTRSLSNVDSNQLQIHRLAQKEIKKTWMKRSAEGEFRWVVTTFPCEALALEADMSLEEYTDFFYTATYCNTNDPIGKWKEIYHDQQQLVDWLEGRKVVHINGSDIEMEFSIEGRTFLIGDGKKNMPCGEIFTGPIENSANGWVRFSYPAIIHGTEVHSVELKFKNGKVVEASAGKNEEFLKSMLDTDDGSRFLGEFGIGTNKHITKFMKDIGYDEKIMGTVHFALGSGYPESGSKNESSIHWDMICDLRDGGQIMIDDELFFENGEFMI